MEKEAVYKYLEELIDKYQNDNDSLLLPTDDFINIDDKKYKRDIWSEEYQGNKLVIFKVEAKAVVGSKSYCLGIEYSDNQVSKKLTNENLWEIGIP